MSETKINASQTTITANDIGAAPVYDTMPTAAVGYLDKIVQYVGATDASYTNGYFYKCVSDGAATPTYSWTRTDVQPGSSLPSQSGNSGKFLTTDGTDASWSDKPLTNIATGTNSLSIKGEAVYRNNSISIGSGAGARGQYSIAAGISAIVEGDTTNCVAIGASTRILSYGHYTVVIGDNAKTSSMGTSHGIAIGASSTIGASYCIQLGQGYNSTANTFSVGLSSSNNYRLLDADGTIPTDRYTTTPSADGTYVPTLTISSGTATRTWGAAASAPVVPATAPTLAVNDWSSNTQTITVSGVTSSNVVLVGPAPSSAQDYADAGILCTAQGTNSLTFTCTTVPSNAITLSVVIFG